MSKVTYNNSNNQFFQSLKNSVDNYFISAKRKKTGNWNLYYKTIVLLTAAVAIYLSLLFLPLTAVWGILLSSIFGIVLASIGFNVMHDACHGSYSERKWLNETLGYSLNALGGNAFIWKFKHNILHHTYTNVDGMDDDIAKSPLMRQCTSQKWVPAHRFQHFYVLFFYAISSFAWIFLMDFNKYFRQKIHNTPLQKMDRKEHFIFWISKVLYVFFYIVIPVIVVGWQAWAIGFIFLHIFMGLTLAIVFQLAHVVEHTEFEKVRAGENMPLNLSWAEHEVRSTADFAVNNKMVCWFTGGLNFQVEHHLFPKISHIHYPAINKIVKEKCREFNLPYHSFPTAKAAIISHFRLMKALGKKPTV
ncbi:MAG: acyl-CoA desaturase [Sphingobacteriales bacterium]|nr:acyl-CoA desaturase [Sphingobacteriales bacterium]MBI3720179.1 acyl-CoA desaturase [Sphingobacteriales bacterium]